MRRGLDRGEEQLPTERKAVLGRWVLTMDPARRILENGCVLIEDGRITAVEGAGFTPAEDVEIIDARDQAVLPGLINGHTHLYGTFGRNLSFDQNFIDWLATQKAFIGAYSEEDFAACVELGLIENICSGNTTIIDNMGLPAASENRLYEAALATAARYGVGYRLARGFTNQKTSPDYIESLDQIESRMRTLAKRHHTGPGARRGLMLSPMVPWGLSMEGYAMMRRLADELSMGIHMHTAETAGYARLIEQTFGHSSNIRIYREGGCLGPDVQLLGCIWVDDTELDWIAESGTTVIMDPTSTLGLGKGLPPANQCLARGIALSLATNGMASNGGQDMFEVMKNAVGLAKIAGGGESALTPEKALEICTIDSARACGLDGHVGSIEVGKRADIITVNLASPFVAPALNVPSAIVFSCKSRDVGHVILDGRVVVRDGEFLLADVPAITARAEIAARAVAERAGMTERTTQAG